MAKRLTNRKILITGGGAGIGRECVNQCIDEGATVAVLDQDVDDLKGAIENNSLANDMQRSGFSIHVIGGASKALEVDAKKL